ncbi:hypothetical protein PHYPSEUDO_004462 [Phytophthora pseudosyringae]|uniref:Uncharacterized protein n=1 Tax=Phytophthora pseudosyringae TaxID=221518 RepID=A0A8T1WPQ7_9STRA|nr:hypothetical protein PHYPSEUDO_004462 [Phytophthora pseudosyringae]
MQKGTPAKKLAPTFQAPTTLPWLPEFEWTDEDELALDRLENDSDTLPDIRGSDEVKTNKNAQETDASLNTATTKAGASKDQKARDRLESRKRLEALLSASLENAAGSTLRKPRWRLETEAESDDVSPFEPEDAEVMEPLPVFRSAVLSVLYTVYLKKMLLEKKLAEKESAMRDFDSMLRVYFDATRMWLGKVVRTPLLSLLQDSSLDVDISPRNGLGGSSLRGFAKKFGGILARRPPPPAQSFASNGQPRESAVDPAKLLKLKVRTRGLLQALSKAIDKEEVPSGILDFWKRISTDGVYFPPSYQLFNEERRHLEFDALGATRKMDFEGTILVDQEGNGSSEDLASQASNGVSRFNIVLINFLLVRILIPHVILQPWNVGIGSKNIGKHTSTNLTNAATLLYCVCRQLSPLPPPVEPPEASFLGRRRSKTIATLQPTVNDDNPAALCGADQALFPAESQEEAHNEDTSFLSIDEIGRRLISDKNFPSNDAQVVQVVKEHQVMLQEALTHLRSQLHGCQG